MDGQQKADEKPSVCFAQGLGSSHDFGEQKSGKHKK